MPSGYLAFVDGLRAIAVLLVLFYHASIPILPGGFIGVDVFFVISGFIITRLLVNEHKNGSFSYFNFYRRRIKRLMPAYIIVLIVSLGIAWFVMLPEDFARLGRSAVAVALLVPNFLFWQEAGDYFDTAAALKPLLHTWSLAVEEQFYLIYPAFLVLLLRLQSRWRVTMISVAMLGSLILTQIILRIDPAAAFFLLPTRIWELLMGALIIFLPLRSSRQSLRTILVIIGLFAIIFSAAFLTREMPFPGILALPACLGSALVISQGGQEPVSSMLLENPVTVYFGKISYSLYLWHWPLLALWRYWNFGELNWQEGLVILCFATVLSSISYHFVEQPIRMSNWRLAQARLVLSSTTAIGLGAGVVLYQYEGLPLRFDQQVIEILEVKQKPHRRSGCMSRGELPLAPEDACVWGDLEDPEIILWGDSHAHALADTAGRLAAEYGHSLRFLGTFSCPPILGIDRPGINNACKTYVQNALSYITYRSQAQTVVITARFAVYLYGNTHAFGPAETLGVNYTQFLAIDGVPLVEQDPLAAFTSRFEETVRRIRQAGKDVVIILPVPEVAFNVPDVVALQLHRGLSVDGFSHISEMYDMRQSAIVSAISDVAVRTGSVTVDPMPLFCSGSACRTTIAGRPLYYDDDHVSELGAELISEFLFAVTNADIP